MEGADFSPLAPFQRSDFFKEMTSKNVDERPLVVTTAQTWWKASMPSVLPRAGGAR